MKECKECERFDGYEHSDGTPICSYEDDNGYSGYEFCPYNETVKTEVKGLSCTVDMGSLDEYIAHTISNSILSRVNVNIDSTITEMIKKEYEGYVKSMTLESLKVKIDEHIDSFMSGNISIGGGWHEPERTLTRSEYMSELIEKELSKKFESNSIKEAITTSVKFEINDRTEKLKKEINIGIKNTFDEVTRKTLTENVVNMLMCSETYTKLQTGMSQLIK